MKNNFPLFKGHHVSIEASAGTGKTYTITQLVLYLTQNQVSLKDIAVVTFTEKAAGELQDRIRKLLESETEEKTDFTGVSIGTIHGFCRKILKEHSIEFGYSGSFKEIESLTDFANSIFSSFWMKIENYKEKYPYLKQTIEVLEFSKFRSLLLEIVQVTGMKRIETPNLKDFSNLHTELKFFAQQFFKDDSYLKTKWQYINIKAIEDHLTILQNGKWEDALDDICKLFSGFSAANKYGMYTELGKFIVSSSGKSEDELKSWYESVSANLNGLYFHGVLNTIIEIANEFSEFLKEALKSADTLTLDQLISVTSDLFLNNFEVRYKTLEKYKYIIIDECQDTSPVQMDLFYNLLKERKEGLILVGDPKQSIYRFQGADVNSYSSAIERFKCSPYFLNDSWRTGPQLTAVINSLFSGIDWGNGIQYHPVNSMRETDKKENPVFFLLDHENEEEDKKEIASERRKKDAMVIANVIQKISYNPDFLISAADGSRKMIFYSDIAVISPKATGFKSLSSVLSNNAIPHNVYKSANFYEEPLVIGLCHLCLVLENPFETLSLVNLLKSEIFLLDDALIQKASEASELNYQKGTWLSELSEIYSSLEKFHGTRYFKSAGNTILEFLNEHKVLLTLSAGFGGNKKLSLVYQFVEILNGMQFLEGKSFGQIANAIRKNLDGKTKQKTRMAFDADDDQDQSIRLMTIHASKGLEFPVVILYDLEGKSPGDSLPVFFKENKLDYRLTLKNQVAKELKTQRFDEIYKNDKEELEREKLRHLYVAVTRAKDYLIAPAPKRDGKSEKLESHMDYWNLILDQEKENELRKENLLFSGIPEFKKTKLNEQINLFDKDWNAGIENISYQEIKLNSPPDDALIRKVAAQKIESYSSLHIVKEENQEGTEKQPIVFTAGFDPRIFGDICHRLIEAIPLEEIGNLKKLESLIQKKGEELFIETGFPDVKDYRLEDAVKFVFSAFTKNYILQNGISATPEIWEHFQREKSFTQFVGQGEIRFIYGIADGFFIYQDQYYILDWKTDYLPEFTNESMMERVREIYSFQAGLYSLSLMENLVWNIPEADREKFWERKFGGMLYIFLRETESEKGHLNIRLDYKSLLDLKGSLISKNKLKETTEKIFSSLD